MNDPQKPHFIFSPRIKGLQILNSNAIFPVGKIYCVGRNYAKHAAEMNTSIDKDEPFFFSKPPQSLNQGNKILFPKNTNDLQHEVELAVCLKFGAENLSKEDAVKCIYGYAACVDLTKRDLQQIAKNEGKPWSASKGFSNSAPISQINTMEGQLIEGGLISLAVNGKQKQKSNLDQMIWKIDEIICSLSRHVALAPGDIILTGTPEGVGPLIKGDEIEIKIESVGEHKFKLT
tara:strand:+ start:486 stop:1181 length:696 start_codon:yes stop_codon:yes gene_type:complete